MGRDATEPAKECALSGGMIPLCGFRQDPSIAGAFMVSCVALPPLYSLFFLHYERMVRFAFHFLSVFHSLSVGLCLAPPPPITLPPLTLAALADVALNKCFVI